MTGGDVAHGGQIENPPIAAVDFLYIIEKSFRPNRKRAFAIRNLPADVEAIEVFANILTVACNAFAIRSRQRQQGAIFPVAPTGQCNHTIGIGDKDNLATVLPVLFQLVEFQFDDDNANDLIIAAYWGGNEKPGPTGCNTDPEKESLMPCNGLIEIGAETVIFADKTVGGVPVA